MEQILADYYNENGEKLHKVVDKILRKFGGISDKDRDDFYSLANEVFTDALKRYDRSQSFDVFLYACLSNKIKSEMTRRNREKRKVKGCIISIDTPVGDDEDSTLKDVIADEFNMEQEIIRKQGERYSKRMLLYLGRLSLLQRKILHLEVIGYSPVEIKEKLQISNKQFADCNAAIRSYRNISVLL